MKEPCPSEPEVLRVGFVCLTAAPLFDEREPGYTGGMEKRAWLFASGLANRKPDCRVAFLVGSQRKRADGTVGNVRVVHAPVRRPWLQRMADEAYKAVQIRRQWPYVRVTRWRRSLLWKLGCRAAWGAWSLATFAKARSRPRPRAIFDRLEADVVVTFSACPHSADAILSARRRGVPNVLVIAADAELQAACRERTGEIRLQPDIARLCLATADYVVVQSESQRRRLAGPPINRESVLVRNPIELTPPPRRAVEPGVRSVLWVGRSDGHHKRPALCLDLARLLPSCRFTMIMNREDDVVHDQVVRRPPDNVRIVDRASPAEMLRHFASCDIFVSTSVAEEEGFPNVFLEAAWCGTVIVSLEADPDGLLSRGPLGICCQGDLKRMAHVIDELFENQDERQRLAQQAADYVRRNHDLEIQVARLHELLASIAGRRGGPRQKSSERSAASVAAAAVVGNAQ